MKVTILGSGSAYGTPMCFNKWGKADPKNSKNVRFRASVCIETAGKTFIVDAGPDFRSQVNQFGVEDLDAVFLTHGHYDHIGGIPELPRASRLLEHPIEVYGSEMTLNEVKTSCGYLFRGEEPEGEGLRWRTLPDVGKFEACGVEFMAMQVPHHKLLCSAFRCKNFAYVTDWQEMPEETKLLLENLDLLLIECNNGVFPEINGHGDLEKVKEVLKKIAPKRVVLTHLSARVDYADFSKELPENWDVAYDGMTVEL